MILFLHSPGGRLDTPRPMRRMLPSASPETSIVVVLAMAILVGLSACGSKPSRVAQAGPAATTSQGGGYYKDDGPGAVVPTNLDQIPDAVPRIEPLHAPALRPYTVMGQRFVPMTELRPYRERGHASWYGRRFHGNPTAIGEPYDMHAMTAAHPTLPLPSYARVTNVANGRSVVVRVNDRGPFLRGRLIDLSYAAAHRLGYVNAGSALVEVEAITHEEIRHAATSGATPAAAAARPAHVVTDPGPATASLPGQLPSVPPEVGAAPYLQLGAFSTPANAEELLVRVRTELSAFSDRLHLLDDGGSFRLQLGPFASTDEARLEAARIGMLLDLQPFIVIR